MQANIYMWLLYSVETKHLRFLDTLNFTASRGPLRTYVKSMGVSTGKSYYPYRLLKNVRSLQLPISKICYKDFYSDLTESNVLDGDHREFRTLIHSHGISEIDALAKLHLEARPLRGFWKFLALKVHIIYCMFYL